MYLKKILKVFVAFFETVLVLFYIFFEELVWERMVKPINALFNRYIGKKIEKLIVDMNPYASLFLFLLTLVVAEAAGLLAAPAVVFAGLAAGIFLYGIKIVLAALAFWIFGKVKDKILSIGWFALIYEKVISLYEFVKETEVYKRVRLKIAEFKRRIFNGKGKLKKVYVKMKEAFRAAAEDGEEVRNKGD